MRFQEVKVKPVERNISQLRASRESQLAGGNSYASSVGGAAPGAVPAGGAVAPPVAPAMDVSQLLSQRVLADERLPVPKAGPASAFETLLAALPELPADAAVAFFEGLASDAPLIAHACVESPKQCRLFFSLLASALTACEGAAAPEPFAAAVSVMQAVGVAAVAADAASAEALMADFGLPKLLPFLRHTSESCRQVLAVVYAFSAPSPTAHVRAVKALQDSLDSQLDFLHALTALITLERDFDEDLLDLYVYYCVIALGMPSSRLRAAALSALSVVRAVNPALVVQPHMLPRLQALCDEPWWEVQAQLGKLCCLLLAAPALPPADASALTDALARVLSSRSPSVLAIVVPEAAMLLGDHPRVAAPFARALVSTPASARPSVLATAPSWPALPVAEALLAVAADDALENLDAAHAEVLGAVLMGTLGSADAAAWGEWLSEHKHYLYVALCDDELCVSVSQSLLRVFSLIQGLALPTFSTLLSSLRMICAPEGHADCQRQANM